LELPKFGYCEVSPHGDARPTDLQKAFQSVECCFDIHSVNCAVEPEPSERMTGTIFLSGMASPGLSALIAASFQFVMPPVKILVTVSPLRRRLETCFPPILRLYMKAVPPATMGMYA